MTIAFVTRRIARLLAQAELKVVFAESCTAGLVSGALSRIPGISGYHCGGVVVYRNETKRAYLDIPQKLLDSVGPVSREVALLMAKNVLKKTPEADLAAAVTGHLGPQAPPKLDGHVYLALAWRQGLSKQRPPAERFIQCAKDQSRVVRQRWVVEQVLELLAEELATAVKK